MFYFNNFVTIINFILNIIFKKFIIFIKLFCTFLFLESMGDDLTYSKGVLLLCFHALQLNKREYIVEFIKKALDKLRNYKPKTASTQCLIANLNFFNIVEKLYARNQAISKQMEEANFTIKAFKTWKGKQLFDGNENENENENEVVPTYGGINIDEDNRLAKELKNIVNMWESCIDNNAVRYHLRFLIFLICLH